MLTYNHITLVLNSSFYHSSSPAAHSIVCLSLVFLSSPLFCTSNYFVVSTVEIKRSLLIFFLVLLDTSGSEAKLKSLSHPVKLWLELAVTVAVSAAKQIDGRMEVKILRRSSALNVSLLRKNEYLAFCQLGTEQISNVFRASLPAHTYEMMDSWIRERLYHLSCKADSRVTFPNGALLLCLVADSRNAKAQISYEISFLTAFEAQPYFFKGIGDQRSCKGNFKNSS